MEVQKVLQADLLDIVFEGRNKNYGAYTLRRNYEKNVKKAMFIGTLAVAFFAGAPFVYSKIMRNLLVVKSEKTTTIFVMKDIEIPKEEIVVPPPPKEVKPPAQNMSIYVPPVVKIDNEVTNEVPPTPPVGNTVAGTDNKIGDGIPQTPEVPDAPTVPTIEPTPISDEPVTTVEQQAEFPGGITELMKYLRDNLRYPEIARDAVIQGRVVLRFVVEKDGSVSNISILKSVHELLDKEAIRVTKGMKNWSPGKQGGRSVRSYFTLPVNFKLE